MTEGISSDDSYNGYSPEDQEWIKEAETHGRIGMALRILFGIAIWVIIRYAFIFLAGGGPETGIWLLDIFCGGVYWMWPLFAYIVIKASAHLHEVSHQEKWIITGISVFFAWPILLNLLSFSLGWVGMESLGESIFSLRWISQVWALLTVLIIMLGMLLFLVITGKRKLT